MIVGVFTGWLLDGGHLQLLLLAGTFLEVFGMMMTSLSTHYWQILLAQGVCTGLGSGLLGLTSVAVIPLYFSSRRMIATGIAATGSSLGSTLVPTVVMCADHSHSRDHLPHHDAAPFPPPWLCLGGAYPRVPHAGLPRRVLRRHAAAPARCPEEEASLAARLY